MHTIQCAEVWGGIQNENLDVCTRSLCASLYSGAADGGKGGDIYYFSVCNADQMSRVALADVVGHGQAASQVSEWLYDSLVEYMDHPDAFEILAQLNTRAGEREFGAITTATVAGFYADDARSLRFACAGHPPMMYRPAGGKWQALKLQDKVPSQGMANLPLGIAPDVRYDQCDLEVGSGAQLLFYTDGVLEAPHAGTGELFGTARLLETLNSIEGDSVSVKNGVLDAVRDFAGDGLEHDDVTLVAVDVS
jgi:sigma-B regulation protein RsbU (phosphoserine phosphatase)